VDGIIDPVPPPLQLDNVEFELLRLSIDIAKDGAAGTSGPVLAGDLAVELGEVSLLDGFVEVLQTLHPWQLVTQTLKVVPGDNLLVHVIKELSASVLFDHS